tara:strand:+ start:703 stop:996 length:294 start_codon:yes stop_codon:yes gene_type:complete
MCFGGGGGSPEKTSSVVDEEQKSKEAEEKKRTIERRQDEKEKTIAQESPIKTSLTYETGSKKGQTVMRGSRGRRALYTSNRGGMGYRNPLGGSGMFG